MIMKRTTIFIVILLLTGMTVFAQAPDMSFYTEEYNRSGATVFDLQDILLVVSNENFTGIGEFYQNAITVFIRNLPNFSGSNQRVAVEGAARLILRGLAAEKHNPAATDIWYLIQYFDIAHQQNDGYLMYEALVAMGQVGAKEYAYNIAEILSGFNARATTNQELKSQIQRVVPGAVNALEALSEPIGVKPILIASAGWYDTDIRDIASSALINIINALGEVIGDVIDGILRDPFNSIAIKYKAWEELLHSNAPDTAKAKVAAAALEASYVAIGSTPDSMNQLRFMRMESIDAIRVLGVHSEHSDAVYAYLERTYREAFETSNRDFESIIRVANTLSAVKSDEAVDLLTQFLRQINVRRQSGPWGTSERDIMYVLLQVIANTRTQSTQTVQLLRIMQSSSNYTGAEQNWVRNTLSALGF